MQAAHRWLAPLVKAGLRMAMNKFRGISRYGIATCLSCEPYVCRCSLCFSATSSDSSCRVQCSMRIS